MSYSWCLRRGAARVASQRDGGRIAGESAYPRLLRRTVDESPAHARSDPLAPRQASHVVPQRSLDPARNRGQETIVPQYRPRRIGHGGQKAPPQGEACVATPPCLTHSSPARTSDVGAGTSDYATTSIPILARAVRAILAVPSVPTPESLEALYALCDTVVRSGRTGSQTLYDQVKMELERAAGAVRTRLTAEGDGEGWLAEVGREWNGFEVRLRLVGDVVLLLDRTFVLTSPALLGIR